MSLLIHVLFVVFLLFLVTLNLQSLNDHGIYIMQELDDLFSVVRPEFLCHSSMSVAFFDSFPFAFDTI